MAIQMRRGNLADFDPTKQMPGEFAVTLDTDNNLNKRALITFAAGTVKQLMTVEDATAQMIEATDAATAEAEAWAHGNSFTATEMFTSAGSATVTLAYSPSSINAVKINDVATTAYTRNDKVITFNTAPAVGSIITVIYGVSTSTDNAKYYKEQAANSASTASTKAAEAGTSSTNAANSASTASTKATEAGNSATLSESYAVGGTGTRPGEDSDNAEYYYEQARDISQSLAGALKPCGTVTYVNLPSLSVALAGDMYNISDAFTTTNDFKEGAGHHINAGANVYKTIDNKWDILAGTPVTGVKGDKEQNYRQGNVNITPANIGAVPTPATSGTNGQVLSTDGQGNTSWKDVQNLLTFDNVPTQNSGNLVKSGGIFSAIDDIKAVKVTDTFSASPTRSGAYINTSGSTVDITSFVSNSDWDCWIFPVVPGDSFVITVDGGSAPRAYCFIDENGNVLSRADASARLTQALITADKRGFCIIQNFVVTVSNPSIVGTLAVSNSAYAKIGDLSRTGLTGDSVAEQLSKLKAVETYEGNLNYSGKYTAYKYGRVVSLKISGVVNPNTSQQMILTESFPPAIRPMVDVNVVGMYGEGGFNASAASVNYRIEANGKIWTYAYQAFSSGTASITYVSAM